MISYPSLDPVALYLGPVQIRWYGIAYVAGILLAWGYATFLANRGIVKVKSRIFSDFIPWATAGIVIGGRLGHVFLYGGGYYWENPLEIFMIWKPGMSFHGGLVGVIVASLLFCRKYKIIFLDLMDLCAVVAPIGLFFGRLANFINSELWGRFSDVPWAIVFPNGGPYPRHPSQLYEACLEGIVLFIFQGVVLSFTKKNTLKSGILSATFLIGYGFLRSIAEFFRDPSDGFIGPLTAGQFWCLPLIFGGLFLLQTRTKKP